MPDRIHDSVTKIVFTAEELDKPPNPDAFREFIQADIAQTIRDIEVRKEESNRA